MTAKPDKHNAGHVLIESAILITVIGFLLSVSVGLFRIHLESSAIEITNNRMETLSRAFSTYIQLRWQIPCPASSKGASNKQFGVAAEKCEKKSAEAYGIIPFRTLGIPEHFARDGYGNFFTYVVSPDFTVDNSLGIAPDTINTRHAHMIRKEDYAIQPISHFCAPIQNTQTDLQIFEYAQPYMPPALQRSAENVSRGTNPNSNLNKTNPVTAIAAAIISHGKNESGIFTPNGRQLRGGGKLERINYDTKNRDIHIQDTTILTNDENHYDDIIQIYTQDQLYALTGGSCEYL